MRTYIKYCAAALTLALLFMLVPTGVYGTSQGTGDETYDNPIHVYVDGQQVQFTCQQPTIVDNHVLVPVREVFEHMGFIVTSCELLLPLEAIAEALGGQSSWDSATRTATITTAHYGLAGDTATVSDSPTDNIDIATNPQEPPHAHFLRRQRQIRYINVDPIYTP